MKGNNIIKKQNLADQIFEILKNKISTGELTDGEKLPGENEIAEIYGVSRMTARSAIQKLSALGIVDVKNGEGTFVKKYKFEDYIMQAAELISNEKTTKSITEFRRYFEPICIELACQKRTPEQINTLAELYQKMLESENSSNIEDFFDADYNFHICICEMTDNTIIKMIYQMLDNLTKQSYEENLRKFAKINNLSTNHKDSNYVVKKMVALHKEFLDDIIKGDNSISKRNWEQSHQQYTEVELPQKDWK